MYQELLKNFRKKSLPCCDKILIMFTEARERFTQVAMQVGLATVLLAGSVLPVRAQSISEEGIVIGEPIMVCDEGHESFGRRLGPHIDWGIRVVTPDDRYLFIRTTDREAQTENPIVVGNFENTGYRRWVAMVIHGLQIPIDSSDGNPSGIEWLWPNRKYLVEVLDEEGEPLAQQEVITPVCPGFRPTFELVIS